MRTNLLIERAIRQNTDFIQEISKLKKQYYAEGQPCYCPFHNDTNKKSGAIYRHDEGHLYLWCFTEQKIYDVIDVLKALGVDIMQYAKDRGLVEIDPEIERVEKEQEVVSKEAKGFLKGDLDYDSYLSSLIEK